MWPMPNLAAGVAAKTAFGAKVGAGIAAVTVAAGGAATIAATTHAPSRVTLPNATSLVPAVPQVHVPVPVLPAAPSAPDLSGAAPALPQPALPTVSKPSLSNPVRTVKSVPSTVTNSLPVPQPTSGSTGGGLSLSMDAQINASGSINTH